MTLTFKEFERDAWEKKASRYNDTWGSVSIQPIAEILDLLDVKKGVKLLDVGCGPGHLAYAASQRGAEVIGCDLSAAMIQIAKKNYSNLEFVVEDAEKYTFADKSFDAVVLNYLLLHVPDQQGTILEAKRILKPGGKLIFTLWLPPSESVGLKIMFDAVKKHADMAVIPPAQDIFTFADLKFAQSFLLANGFSEVKTKRFETYWKVESPTAFFLAVQAGTRIGGLIDLQKPEIKNQIRLAIEQEVEALKSADGYIVPTPSLIVCAENS